MLEEKSHTLAWWKVQNLMIFLEDQQCYITGNIGINVQDAVRSYSMFTKRQNKYGNHKTMLDKILFDSKKEAEYYLYLKSEKQKGNILELRFQAPFTLQEGFKDRHGSKHQPITYICDFIYLDKHALWHIVDVKGMRTEVYKLKKKLFLYKYPEMIFEEI